VRQKAGPDFSLSVGHANMLAAIGDLVEWVAQVLRAAVRLTNVPVRLDWE